MMPGNNWLFFSGITLAIIAVILFIFNKKTAAVCLLTIAGVVLRTYMAYLDPFLHDWDEKFHAIVARNMMDDPFKPYLRLPLATYDYKAWCCNYIWVHKQPLFMWQMALSMKIFGVSEFAIRYPSVLMGALMIPMVYRIARLANAGSTIAFIAAMFMCFSAYNLNLVSGKLGMDHNDTAFAFYVLASTWAYAEYNQKQKAGWALLIGVFAGCAVLNKWLTGMLVFAAWGINILLSLRQKETRKEMLHMLLAVAACVVVFLPWQLYILKAFPQEARYEFDYNSKHIFEAVEGHGGDWRYYWDLFHMYFAERIGILVPVGLLMVLMLKKYRNKTARLLAVCIMTVFVFFSFIVKTKMPNYFFIAVPIGFILIAIALCEIATLVRLQDKVQIAVAAFFCFVILNPAEMRKLYATDDHYRISRIYNTKIYKNLSKEIPPDIKLVMNVNQFEDIDVMFYNKGITAYHWTPDEDSRTRMMQAYMPIAVFKGRPGYDLPWDMVKYPLLYIIKSDLK